MSELTVIVLVWNQPELLAYTLYQMKNQDYITPKLIVVDDCSDLVETRKQQSVSEYYGAKYIYEPTYPKRFRKTKCGLLGIEQTDTEFVGVFDVHFYYDKDYLYKCLSIMKRYTNLVLSNHSWWCKEWLDRINFRRTLRHLDGTNHIPPCDCINWDCYCKQDEIRPTPYGQYADGNMFFRTEVANKCYDPNIYGYGNFSGDISFSALHNGQSVVVLGDVHTYHITHNKQLFNRQLSEQSKMREYIESKYKSWGVVPPDNGLVLV